MGLFSKIFPSHNDRELKKISKIVDKIESLEEQFKAMSDEQLMACTQSYVDRHMAGESLDKLLPEAFATVREASTRVLGMRHFRVQLMGGIVLYQGRIAEMRTGEGKTLVATLGAYLKALDKKGVHVVTVNEYLAKRDAEWMGKVYKFLGLTVSVNLSGMSHDEKAEAYKCDIMYTTNSELGFDYLRDNMVKDKNDKVQRGLDFAIVDEVDSILIDEARTPLILSGRGGKPSEEYARADKFVKTLLPPKELLEEDEGEEAQQEETDEELQDEETLEDSNVENNKKKDKKQSQSEEEDEEEEEEEPSDFEISLKDKAVYLNERGAKKAEEYYGIENLADYESQSIKHYIDNALKANYIMKEGINYIVSNGEIIIVDEFTGRQMVGRRFSDGLHQAIEAKEGVVVKAETITAATITIQNYFRLYKRLSGMTGTAKTEENEFDSIYGLDVVVIPPNKENQRKDEPFKLYKTRADKNNAIVRDVKSCYEEGRPVLIGTVSVESSEELSKILTKNGIPHNVLNAKNHEKEAEIIAQAGKLGSVTIATNMAGRGTDILLGGNPEYTARLELEKTGAASELIEQALSHAHTDNKEVIELRGKYQKICDRESQKTQEDKKKVIDKGGLKIIGTELNDSRRIDNQLRGRSGRQGDPGTSVFYLSLQDDIVKLFGDDRIKRFVDMINLDENEEIESKFLTKQFENLQAKVEDKNFSARKHVLGYDDVVNAQRSIIYEQRNIVLDDMDVHQQIIAMIEAVITTICNNHVDNKVDYEKWNYDAFNAALEDCVLEEGTNLLSPQYIEKLTDNSVEGLVKSINDIVVKNYEEKIVQFDAETGEEQADKYKFDYLEKAFMLDVVDKKWMQHLDDMEKLKQSIGLVAYAQRNPVDQYRIEGFEMFEDMINSIQKNVVSILVKTDFFANKMQIIENIKERRQRQKNMMLFSNKQRSDKAKANAKGKAKDNPNRVKGQTVVRTTIKLGPNEKCHCGSGKKYKNCCMNKDNQNKYTYK